jgi:hypothetical protein
MGKILTPERAKRQEELSKTKKVASSEAYVKQSPSDEILRTAATNEVRKEQGSKIGDLNQFVRRVADKFVQMKLHEFPKICRETRRVNYLQRKELKQMDNEKGWSDKKTMMVSYVIPKELYLFMTNMVYIKFWSDENEKVWRSFMKGIMRGDDPETLLMGVMKYYAGLQARMVY